MTERLPDPSGMGHDLLTEWGQWMRDDREGRAGWSVKPRLDPVHSGEPPDRVVWVDRLIAPYRAMKSQNKTWTVVAQYYMGDRSMWEIASREDWSLGRVQTLLLSVCGMVEREWEDLVLT